MEVGAKNWAMALLLAVLGLLAYGNTLGGAWVWDDVSSVLLHKHVQDPSKFFQLFREDQHAFGRGEGNFYRPLVAASFMLDYQLSHDPAKDLDPELPYPAVRPLVFHLTNAAWHIAAAIFLVLLLGRLGAPDWVRGAAAVLFVLHPLHTEAVAYISGRADMMSGTFMFAGLYFAASRAAGTARVVSTALALLCFTLGLLSKESSFIFPVLMLLVVLTRVAEDGADRVPFLKRRGAPVFLGSVAVLAGYGILRVFVLKFASGGASAAAPFGQRVIETLQALAWYIQLLFWPTGLHMERTLDGATMFTAALGAAALAGIIAGAIAAWRAGHRRITLGLVWFLATWLPISGIFPLNAPMAEHWLYVPMAGFWWALLEGVALLLPASQERGFSGPRALATGAVALLALVLLSATIERNRDWGSNEALFRATLRENPKTTRVTYNLAMTYGGEQQNNAGARRAYEHLLALYESDPLPGGGMRPDEPEVRLLYGEKLMRQGDYSAAIAQLSKLIPLSKDPSQAQLVGQALFAIGQCSLAIGEVAQADRAFSGASQALPALRPVCEAIASGAAIIEK